MSDTLSADPPSIFGLAIIRKVVAILGPRPSDIPGVGNEGCSGERRAVVSELGPAEEKRWGWRHQCRLAANVKRRMERCHRANAS